MLNFHRMTIGYTFAPTVKTIKYYKRKEKASPPCGETAGCPKPNEMKKG